MLRQIFCAPHLRQRIKILCLLGMDEYRSELRAAFEELIVLLQESSSGGNRELCCVRLEILAENALLVESIPLEIVDVLTQAIAALKNKNDVEKEFASYEAPAEIQGGRGRPKFSISEEQLVFFRGN